MTFKINEELRQQKVEIKNKSENSKIYASNYKEIAFLFLIQYKELNLSRWEKNSITLEILKKLIYY